MKHKIISFPLEYTFRKLQESDVGLLIKFTEALSIETIDSRFKGVSSVLAVNEYFIDHMGRNTFILCETKDNQETIIGIGEYGLFYDTGIARLGVLIKDSEQNKGYGTILAKEVMAQAKKHGTKGFFAESSNKYVKKIKQKLGIK